MAQFSILIFHMNELVSFGVWDLLGAAVFPLESFSAAVLL